MRNFRKTDVLVELELNCGEIFMFSRGGKVKNYTVGSIEGVGKTNMYLYLPN